MQGCMVALVCPVRAMENGKAPMGLEGWGAMTLNQWVPWLLGAGNATSALLTGNRKLAGWPVLIITQLAFIAYAVATDQTGFVLQNYLMIAIATYNTFEWMRAPAPMLNMNLQPAGM